MHIPSSDRLLGSSSGSEYTRPYQSTIGVNSRSKLIDLQLVEQITKKKGTIRQFHIRTEEPPGTSSNTTLVAGDDEGTVS